MSSVSVRIASQTHQVLKQLAAQGGRSLQETIEDAVEAYRRRLVLEEANAAYAALRADPQAWQEEIEERELWDQSLLDGIEER
jgi:hypothetical protein